MAFNIPYTNLGLHLTHYRHNKQTINKYMYNNHKNLETQETLL